MNTLHNPFQRRFPIKKVNKTTLNEDCDNGIQIVKEKIDVYLYY